MNQSVPFGGQTHRSKRRRVHTKTVGIARLLLLSGGVFASVPTSAANLGTLDIDCGTGGLVRIPLKGTVGDTYIINPVSETTCYVTATPGVVSWSVAGAPNPPLFDAYTGGRATIEIVATGSASWQASQTWGLPPRVDGVVLDITATAAQPTAAMTRPKPSDWSRFAPALWAISALMILPAVGAMGIGMYRSRIAQKRDSAGGTPTLARALPDPEANNVVPPAAAPRIRPHLKAVLNVEGRRDRAEASERPIKRANETEGPEHQSHRAPNGLSADSATAGDSPALRGLSEAETVRADATSHGGSA
jgi:hypothetical protein